jgi:hypothetical protein
VPNVPQAQKSFWTHLMELLGDMGHVKSHFGPLETLLVSVQDRSTVWPECSISSGIVSDANDGTPM